MAKTNSVNCNSTGVVAYDNSTGVFSASAITQHDVLVGGSGNSITSISPSTSGFVLTSSGISADPSFAAPAGSSKITTFNTSGTWTLDSRTKEVETYIWGSGGGGGSGRSGVSATSGGGAGGGSGNCFYNKFIASQLVSSPYTITIGTGGAGGGSQSTALTNGNPGIQGGSTSIGTLVSVPGGLGGLGGSTSNTSQRTSNSYNYNIVTPIISTLGAIATATDASNIIYGWSTGSGGSSGYTLSTPRAGAKGGDIIDIGGNVIVAGGTAGNTSGSNGGNGNAPSSTDIPINIGGTSGGGGGMDGTTNAGSGGNGGFPAGGGGGGAGNLSTNPSGAGGNGANGKIVIIEYF